MSRPAAGEAQASIDRLGNEIRAAREELARLRDAKSDLVSLVCFSGEWDRLFAAFTIANGALAMGQEVHLFFTFWAAAAIRDATRQKPGKPWLDRMMGWAIPSGVDRASLSKMNWGGLGKAFLARRMRKHGVDEIQVLMKRAEEMGAHFHLCDTSAALLGFGSEELLVGGEIDLCGVATFLSKAAKGKIVLFI